MTDLQEKFLQRPVPSFSEFSLVTDFGGTSVGLHHHQQPAGGFGTSATSRPQRHLILVMLTRGDDVIKARVQMLNWPTASSSDVSSNATMTRLTSSCCRALQRTGSYSTVQKSWATTYCLWEQDCLVIFEVLMSNSSAFWSVFFGFSPSARPSSEESVLFLLLFFWIIN